MIAANITVVVGLFEGLVSLLRHLLVRRLIREVFLVQVRLGYVGSLRNVMGCTTYESNLAT